MVASRSPPEASAGSLVISVLRNRSDFLAANRGLRVARPGFVLLARPNGGMGKRYGITVTKKIGNAVVRNRMKRRFRELLRNALPKEGLPDHDHVLIGREGGIEREFATLRAELSAALTRAADGKGDPPPAAEAAQVKRLLILVARGWQLGPSRVVPPSCRYTPSCSEYAIQAVEKYGAIKGGWLAAKRLLRCHPWGGHGYDPVP